MFTSIAFGGGGMRGTLHVGGLKAVSEFQESLTFPNGIYGYSIGAVIATAVAFNLKLPQLEQMIEDSMNLESVVKEVTLACVYNLVQRCGMFQMDHVEESIVNAFLKQGVDLRGKSIDDAPQKLYIGASDLTTRKPVFFSGRVPLLSALRASCCIPGFFQPQVIYDHVYVDGGLYMYYLDDYLPKDCLTFVVSYSPRSLYPTDLDGNLMEFAKQLYAGQRRPPKSKNALWFKEDKVHVIQEVTPGDRKRLLDEGYSQTLAFLSKRVTKKSE
jgi:NTE family protein